MSHPSTQDRIGRLPAFHELPECPGQPKGCTWGFWDSNGQLDELGTLNLLTPDTVREAATEIRDFKDVNELRGKFALARPSYAPSVPATGFEITHQLVRVSDGTEVEIRVYRPEGQVGNLPLFFVIHGGGMYASS